MRKDTSPIERKISRSAEPSFADRLRPAAKFRRGAGPPKLGIAGAITPGYAN